MVKKHSNKEIRAAINYAIEHGWKVKPGSTSSHSWGQIYCPNNDAECRCREFCLTSIWSTPRNPRNHAKQIKRVVDNCIHIKNEGKKKLGEEDERV